MLHISLFWPLPASSLSPFLPFSLSLYLPPIQYELLSGPWMYLILSHVLAFKHTIPLPGMLSSPLTSHHLRRGVSLNPQTREAFHPYSGLLLYCDVCVSVLPLDTVSLGGQRPALLPLLSGRPGTEASLCQWCVNVHWTVPADCTVKAAIGHYVMTIWFSATLTRTTKLVQSNHWSPWVFAASVV